MKFLLFGYQSLGQDVFCHGIDQTALMFLLIQERVEVNKGLLVQFISSFLFLDFLLQSIFGLDNHNVNCGLFEFLSCSRELCHQLQSAGDYN